MLKPQGLGLLVSVPVGFIALAKAFDDFGFSAQGTLVTPPPPRIGRWGTMLRWLVNDGAA